jgi:hypothetical protein
VAVTIAFNQIRDSCTDAIELASPSRCSHRFQVRPEFAADSLLEGSGFELVWGFSCQVVVLGFAESSLFGGVSR